MRLREAVTGALKHMRHHRIGMCTICGRPTIFVCVDPATVRNNMLCALCRCSSRQRHVAKVLLKEVAGDASTIPRMSDVRRAGQVSIYNTDATGALARVLGSVGGCVSSGLYPGRTRGEEISAGIYNQDLEALTFESGVFDAVLSEDVFEHVRRYRDGFKEVWRVLKPGGVHIFTVPFRFDRGTLIRVDTTGDEDVHLLPPEYHGDRIRGRILAYRTFGIDMFDDLRELGFDTSVEFSTYGDRRHGIHDSYVFVSRKVEPPGT